MLLQPFQHSDIGSSSELGSNIHSHRGKLFRDLRMLFRSEAGILQQRLQNPRRMHGTRAGEQ